MRAGRAQGGVCAAVCRAGARERARRDSQAMRGQLAWACASFSSAKNPAFESGGSPGLCVWILYNCT